MFPAGFPEMTPKVCKKCTAKSIGKIKYKSQGGESRVLVRNTWFFGGWCWLRSCSEHIKQCTHLKSGVPQRAPTSKVPKHTRADTDSPKQWGTVAPKYESGKIKKRKRDRKRAKHCMATLGAGPPRREFYQAFRRERANIAWQWVIML